MLPERGNRTRSPLLLTPLLVVAEDEALLGDLRLEDSAPVAVVLLVAEDSAQAWAALVEEALARAWVVEVEASARAWVALVEEASAEAVLCSAVLALAPGEPRRPPGSPRLT